MPYESPLYDFLDDLDLQHYHQEFVNKLGVTALDHLTYVQQDDVDQLGMSQPEWRRLRASMKKVKKAKKGGKNVTKPPPPLSRMTAPGPGGPPSGGHIIPATDINILDKELGRGEFGKVMQGVWSNREGNQIPVAVKCLSPEKLSLDKCQQDFLKEAAIMHSLNHEHLVKLYGVVLDVDSSLMLVTEFAPLRSLAENMKQEALKPAFPITLLLDFSVQITDAMRYLHMSNIIHRDLAARNILLFVDDEGNKKAKISDFGLSRRLLLGENYRSEMRPNLKLPLAWMPVESLTKLTFTKASDVWSFGVTMWEMFSYGRKPFAHLSGEEILKTIDKPRLERLERPEACPLKIYELMLRCWTHEPESRMSFAELHEELPKARPMQVKTLVNYVALHPEELTFRAEDILSVVEANDDTGVWKGINPMGKIGYFQRVDTVALGNSQMGKLKRWRSGRSSKTENRRSWHGHGKLSLEDISKPKDYKHIFHVGVDGKVEGDPTFGGDYRNIPKTDEEDEEEGSSPSRSSSTSGRSDSKSSTPSKSPNKSKKNNKKNISAPVIELSKDTILPPPNGFDSGSTVSVPDVVPSVTQQVSSAPPPIPRQPPQKPQPLQKVQKAPIAVLAEPEVTFTNGTSSTFKQDRREEKKDGDLSLTPSFDMGSLLDDMMSVWDSAKLNLSFSDDLEPTPEEEPDDFMEEEDSLLEGEENAFCNGNSSLSPPTLSVGTVNPVAMEAVVVANDVEVAEEEAGAVNEAQEEAELGAVGGVSAAGVSNTGKSAEGSILSGNIIIKDSMTKPTKTFRKVPRQTEEGEVNEGVAKPEIRPQEQSQAPRSRPGMDMNIARQMSREKRWDNEFKRLSSSPKDKSSDNEYIDTKTMNQKVDNSSEEYEELALASSPQPYTLRDNVLDSANVMRVPRFNDVSRSVSLRTTRPGTDHSDSRVEVDLNRSRSLREPPVSPLGQQAYDSLVGGNISGNLRRKRPDAPERKPPVVPPKPAPKPPSRVKAPDVSGEGRFRNGEARLSGSSSQRSYSGTSSDDGMSEDNPNIQVTSGDIAGKSGAVASLRQRFNTNQTEDTPPRPPPREPTDTKVSSFSGVRLRRREQTNGTNENFYASEPDNNNASPKFSSTTLQNLEQHMPRRVRRSVGEDRIKRRNSSDASDSDTDVAKTRTDRVWSTSSHAASEGDSSSDETVGSNRLSTSSTERSSYSETQSSSGYKSPPRSLYDLPEDQTNSTSSRADQPSLSSEDPLSMDHRPPPLPPRVATDSTTTTTTHRKAPDRPPSGGRDAHWTRPPEAGGHNGDIPQNAVPPPRPVRYDIYDRLPRSRTVDLGEHALDSQKRATRPDYDVLPVRRPVWNQNKSYSMDGEDSDDYMVGSAASLRQLLRQPNVSSNENVNNNHDEIDSDADNLEDMPDMSPPPVPTTRKSFIDSTYGESPFVQRSVTPDTSVAPVQRHSIREPEYVMMKPQSVQDLKREYTQLSSADSDYAVPINHKHTSPNNNSSPIQNNAANARYLSDKDKAIYLLMHPKRSSTQQSNNSSHSFTRTKSAHLVRRPAFLRAARTPEQRRGTVSASTRLKDAEGSSSLPRSDQSAGEGHKMRRSRSTDDILKDGDWTMPEEAESLQDLLARAHISPTDHHSTKDPRSNYLVPPSARRKLPSPDAHQITTSTPPPSSHTRPHSLNQTPPSSGYHGEAAYLDMSQNSLERKKKNEQEKAASNWIKPVQTSSEHSSSSSSSAITTKPVSSKGNRLSYPPISSSNQTKAVPSSMAAPHILSKYVYDPNDDEVDL
ncbi:uncharacterized protein LOC587777 isoform X4 [Strongylocentrotus purpuratus]|uniref:non-specific protein-tyrosine kinase n=1 Tax=Strongylocentrotus purpuratus TaxID=7668 RepID=A0A7M7NXA9_STRPU|nr:uncharacterized protein LOC587777 isoform X4 [Strongylocentrotus purpuratus]